jgi:hypothetical protein
VEKVAKPARVLTFIGERTKKSSNGETAMFASAQVRVITMAASVPISLAALSAAPAQADQDDGELPLTPPPFESTNTQVETVSPEQPSGSVGVTLFTVLAGPVGLALSGVTTAAAVSSASAYVAQPYNATSGFPGERGPAGGLE